MNYSDAKSYCSSQSVVYQGVKINAQLFDVRSTAYTQFVKGEEISKLIYDRFEKSKLS